MAEKDVARDAATEENTVAKDIVVTKYKMAAEIVNGTVITRVIHRCHFNVTGSTFLIDWNFDICHHQSMPRRGFLLAIVRVPLE